MGRYGSKGEDLSVDVVLFRGEEERARFSVVGTKTELEALVQRILDETRRGLK